MSQSLCARCLDPIPPGRVHHGKILCDACESAWRIEFDRNMRHHLARLDDGPDAAPRTRRPLPVAAE